MPFTLGVAVVDRNSLVATMTPGPEGWSAQPDSFRVQHSINGSPFVAVPAQRLYVDGAGAAAAANPFPHPGGTGSVSVGILSPYAAEDVVDVRVTYVVDGVDDQTEVARATTDSYPAVACGPATNVAEDSATIPFRATSGRFNATEFPANYGSYDNRDHLRIVYGTTPGGPYPLQWDAPRATNASTNPANLTGLTPGTTYYYRLQADEYSEVNGGGTPRNNSSGPRRNEFLDVGECSFTTATPAEEIPGTGVAFEACEGDEGGPDVENTILCDRDANGEIVGTALAVYTYEDGVPVGPPEFVDPATGEPYEVQGTLSPCEQCQPAAPETFFFTTSTTGPADFPGRSYEGTLNISRGYRVDQLSIGGTNFPVSITWSILDTEGTDFAEALRAAIQSRIPGSTVTVTPPPIDRCDTSPRPFLIEIDCIDADEAPNDVTIRYDGGTDLVQNPAQLADDGQPAVGPGQLGFQLRQDDDGTYQPQAPHTLDCTAVDGEGWYLTPQARFETWGAGFLGTTPTPRGGSIIELNTTTGTPEWLHQKVTVPADGTYTLRAFLGGRAGEVTWNLRLSTGDTGSTGGGDIANITQVTAPVAEHPNPQPWTRLEQLSIPLTAGTYTLSMTGTGGGGALYTDLQLFTTEAGTIQSLTANDDCINTREVTTNTVDCQQWIPQRDGNCEIVAWRRLDTGEIQTNDAFFAQVPAPVGCYIAPEGEAPEVTFGNLIHTYPICAAGENLQRTIITDNSGNPISESFTDENGTQVGPPASYTIGECPNGAHDVEVSLVCVNGQPAFREATFFNGFLQSTQFVGPDGVVITPAPTAWTPGPCSDAPADRERICYTLTSSGDEVLLGWARHDDDIPGAGIAYFTSDGTPIDPSADGFTQVLCQTPDGQNQQVEEEVVCADLGQGQPAPVMRRVTIDANGVESVAYLVGQGGATVDVTGAVQGWTAGACDNEYEILCDANGVPFRMRHHNPTASNPQGLSFFTLGGNPINPAPTEPYQRCEPDPVDDEVTEYETVVQDVTAGNTLNIPNGGDLVAWTVRNRNATTATVQVNGGAVLPLDVGETLGADLSGHDTNDVLIDDFTVIGGDGIVRVTTTRRL